MTTMRVEVKREPGGGTVGRVVRAAGPGSRVVRARVTRRRAILLIEVAHDAAATARRLRLAGASAAFSGSPSV